MMLTAEELAAACNADDEFVLAARRWNGALRFHIDDGVVGLSLRDGVAGPWTMADLDVPTIDSPVRHPSWDRSRAPSASTAERSAAGRVHRALVRSGDEMVYWQYFPAIARIIEVRARVEAARCRTPAVARRPRRRRGSTARSGATSTSTSTASTTASTSRKPGQGIPLLMQHTAGSHGVQFRHLFEMPEITDHFRLIAYDLPFHGKSVPPTSVAWWTQPYRADRAFAMALPIALSAASSSTGRRSWAARSAASSPSTSPASTPTSSAP